MALGGARFPWDLSGDSSEYTNQAIVFGVVIFIIGMIIYTVWKFFSGN